MQMKIHEKQKYMMKYNNNKKKKKTSNFDEVIM